MKTKLYHGYASLQTTAILIKEDIE